MALDVNDEKHILGDIARGDRKAMEELYVRYAGYATAVAHRYVLDDDHVRDVLQDSFIKVFTNLSHFSYRGEGSLKAWVMRIVANEAISSLRRNTKIVFTDHLPETDADESEPEIEGVPPDVLNQLICQLPHGYRVVLNMFVFEQKSHKEIAQCLGIKEDSSASQFYRAKKMLARMINDYKKRRS